MTRYWGDLHLHSCLSPCGDEDMTPHNIAGMATLNGLQIVALTDHNSCKNCPAFFAACKEQGIVPIPGTELTTAEEIHLLCLFETLEQAMAADEELDKMRIPVRNRPEIFGRQLILDEKDEISGEVENLLLNALPLSLDEAYAWAVSHGAVAYPAHIDRESNGIIAILGALPQQPQFHNVEFNQASNIAPYRETYGLQNKRILVSSDAHNLWSIQEQEQAFDLTVEPYSSQGVRSALLRQLKTALGKDLK